MTTNTPRVKSAWWAMLIALPTGACIIDMDRDGYTKAVDCNDDDLNIHPGAFDDPLTHADENCDGTPGSQEGCDGVDNDGDALIDEGVSSTYYEDRDRDGYGSDAQDGPRPDLCAPAPGWARNALDCQDLNPEVNPAAVERCNDMDDDCDLFTDLEDPQGVEGQTTLYPDRDGDGYGDQDVADGSSSTLPIYGCEGIDTRGYVTEAGDCDDLDAAISPKSSEVCNGQDDDCNGATDEGDVKDGISVYADRDGDGYGSAASFLKACSPPSGYTTNSQDCRDDDASIGPFAVEVCDSRDNNCDGSVDNSAIDATPYYEDSDADGYGDITVDPELACARPLLYSDNNTDCDDSNSLVYPTAKEWPDLEDNDCDRTVDETVDLDGDCVADDSDCDDTNELAQILEFQKEFIYTGENWISDFGDTSSLTRVMVGDIFGDGRVDAVVFSDDVSTCYSGCATDSTYAKTQYCPGSTDSTTSTAACMATCDRRRGMWTVAVAQDTDADGDADKFGGANRWTYLHGVDSDDQFVADITGDGKAEGVEVTDGTWKALSYVDADGDFEIDWTDQNQDCVVDSSASVSKTFATGLWPSKSATWNRWFIADIDGDGINDAAAYSPFLNYWQWARSSGSGFSSAKDLSSGSIAVPTPGGAFLVDVTGEGCADIVTVDEYGTWVVGDNHCGTTPATRSTWATSMGASADLVLLADVNGDAMADAIMLYQAYYASGSIEVMKETNGAWGGIYDLDPANGLDDHYEKGYSAVVKVGLSNGTSFVEDLDDYWITDFGGNANWFFAANLDEATSVHPPYEVTADLLAVETDGSGSFKVALATGYTCERDTKVDPDVCSP